MTNTLHTDTYYRGYRFATNDATGKVDIYYGTDKVDITDSVDIAKAMVDDWQNAR